MCFPSCADNDSQCADNDTAVKLILGEIEHVSNHQITDDIHQGYEVNPGALDNFINILYPINYKKGWNMFQLVLHSLAINHFHIPGLTNMLDMLERLVNIRLLSSLDQVDPRKSTALWPLRAAAAAVHGWLFVG